MAVETHQSDIIVHLKKNSKVETTLVLQTSPFLQLRQLLQQVLNRFKLYLRVAEQQRNQVTHLIGLFIWVFLEKEVDEFV